MRQTTTYSSYGGDRKPGQYSNIDDIALDIIGDRAAVLEWERRVGNVEVFPGGTNVSILNEFKGSITRLWEDFFCGDTGLKLSTEKEDQLRKRLLLLEHEVDGLLKRRIQFCLKDKEGGERILDYTGLLNEKENQIIELEKKIQNFEERLRRASARELELQNEIERLRADYRKLERPNLTKAQINEIIQKSEEFLTMKRTQESMRGRLQGLAGLLKTHSDQLRGKGIVFEYENELNTLIRNEGLEVSTIGGILNLGLQGERVVEIPVSDARTKHLIHMLAVQMKKFVEKYPKLREQMDGRLYEFFQQELIDCIEVDEIDRIVEIVKYVPEVVKVQNVYAYSSEKSRKVEFHLRVLIKALLQQLMKLKLKTGAVLDIDEGVIGMIKAEIMDVVNIDDILKVFRVVPKIVEVEKIVEKIVERVIEIPQVIPVEKICEKIVEIVKIQEVEKIVHVPVEVIKYVDVEKEKVVVVEKQVEKIVQVPRIIEVIVERVVEVPKVIYQEVIVEKIVEVDRPRVVSEVINHVSEQIREVEVIKEKIVTVETIREVPKPIEVIVEKIVEKVVHVPQLVTCERRNDVLVKQIQVRNAREVCNYIEKVPEIHEVCIEKPIPMIQTVERIVEVPQIIEKIVECRVEVPRIEKITVVEEKIVYRDRIKEVIKEVHHTVELKKEVEKIVEQRIEVPIIHERIVKVPEVITQIAVEKFHTTEIVEVERWVDKIIEVPKIIEVEKPIIVCVEVEKPVKIMVEKIVEVPKTIERIKEVRCYIDKIIEKMVEVPKVVEVQKIVEKIVVVPRVIEKIVEVPQIVEKCVDRIIQNTEIIEVEKIVQVPVYTERIKEVEIECNHYYPQPEIVEKCFEKIVAKPESHTVVEVVEKPVEKIIEVRTEVPREIKVDKVCTLIEEVCKVLEVEKTIIVPVEVPIPVDRKCVEPFIVQKEVEKIVTCIQTVEKIVEVRCETIKVEEVERNKVEVVIQEKYKEIEKVVPYIQTEYKEIECIQQKIVLNNVPVEKIVEVDVLIEKICPIYETISTPVEVECYKEKVVEVTKIIPVDNKYPVVVEVPQIVECIRDRPIEIPIIEEIIKECKVTEEKIVSIATKETEVKQVSVTKDKVVPHKELQIVENIVNHIETRVECVDRYEDKIIPITTCVEKIIEVPYILEKIVEKIVIMPQVVEVLKYVHEIVEQETLGVAVGVTVVEQQARYRELYGKIKPQFQFILVQLRKIRNSNPSCRSQIDLLERFLVDLEGLIAFPKIVQVDKRVQIEVEKSVPVLVGKVDLETERFQVTLSMIVGKLVGQILRIKKENPSMKLNIDGELLTAFTGQFHERSGILICEDRDFKSRLSQISQYFENFLCGLGGSSLSHEQELMYSCALEERLLMTALIEQANCEIDKAKQISEIRGEAFRKMVETLDQLLAKFGIVEQCVVKFGIDDKARKQIDIFRTLIADGKKSFLSLGSVEPIRSLSTIGEGIVSEHVAYLDPHLLKFAGNLDNDVFIRLQGAFRALQKQNELLRDKYVRWQSARPNIHGVQDRDRIIDTLERRIVELQGEINGYRTQTSVSVNVSGNTEAYERQISTLNNRIIELEGRLRQSSGASSSNQENEIKIRTLNSKIQELESQNRTVKVEYDGKIRSKDKYISELEDKIRVLEERVKGGDSRVTGLGNTVYTPSNYSSSNRDGMSQSQHSATGSERSDSGIRQSGNYTSGTYKAGETQNSGLSGSGASYGQGSQLSGSGASYGQNYSRNYQTTGATGTTSTITSGSGSGSGATYGGQTQTGGYTRYGSTNPTTTSYSGSTITPSQGTTQYGTTQYGTGISRTSGVSGVSGVSGTTGTSGTSQSYTRYQPSQ